MAAEGGLVKEAEKLVINESNGKNAPIAEHDAQSEASCSNERNSQKAPSVSSSTTSPNITKAGFILFML